jgi:SAM-dependent methyltransferase
VDFNRYAKRYEQAVQDSLPGRHVNVEVFARTKAAHLAALVERRLGRVHERRVLDVGCGVGVTDRFLVDRFGAVEGVDTAEDLVAVASNANPRVAYRGYDGSSLPYADDSFDVTFAICVLHHVDPPSWGHVTGEMRRVTRPGGIVAIFEHNPLNPLTRRAVRNCEFDVGVVLLRIGQAMEVVRRSGLTVVERRFITFLPFAGRVSRLTESALRRVPLGAQYYVAGTKPRVED